MKTLIHGFVVPEAIVGRDGDPRKLFELVGLGRAWRRKRGQSDGALIAQLMFPEERLHRFWLFGLPDALGESTPVKRVDLPTVDLAWLRQFRPQFVSEMPDQAALYDEFPELIGLEKRLREWFPPFESADFHLDLRPFSVWSHAKAALERWNTMNERDRELLLGAIVALDGISGGCFFTNRAVALVPVVAEYLHAFDAAQKSAGPAQSFDETKCDSVPAVPLIPALPAKAEWHLTLTRMADLIAAAANSDPESEIVTRLRKEVEGLSECLERSDAELDAISQFEGELDAFVGELEGAARMHDLAWLSHERIHSFKGAWTRSFEESSPEARIGIRHALGQLAARAIGGLADLNVERDSRNELAGQLESLRERITPATAPREKKELIEARQELQRRIDGLDASMAGREEELDTQIAPPSLEGLSNAIPAELQPEIERPEFTERIADASNILPTLPAESVPNVSERGAAESDCEVPTTHQSAIAAESAVDSGKPAREDSGVLPLADRVEAFPAAPESISTSDTVEASPGPETSDDDGFDVASGEACRPIWSAIRNGEADLAYQIASALRADSPDLRVPPLPLLRVVALAPHVEAGHGELAAAIAQAFGEIDPNELADGPDDWQAAISLLTIAATLRACLIAPNTGATGVIRYAHPTPALHELREAIVQTGERLQWLNVTRASFRAIQSQAEWESLASGLERDLAEWQKRAPAVTINYQAATNVWRRLQEPSGRLGSLVETLRKLDSNDVPHVLQEVRFLSDPVAFRKLVNDVDRSQPHRRRGEVIEAGAFQQLRDKTSDVVRFAERWLEVVQGKPGNGGFLSDKLQDLMATVRRLRPAIDAELGDATRRGDKWQLVESASVALRKAINDVESLQSGAVVIEQDASPGELLGRCLLWAPALDLDDEWRPMQPPAAVLEAAMPLIGRETDARRVLDERVQRGDFRGARRLVKLLVGKGDPKADEWGRRLEDDLDLARKRLGETLTSARRELEGALAFGYLSENDRAGLDQTLVAISDSLPSTDEFAPKYAAIATVHANIARFKDTRLAEVKAQIEQLPPETSASDRRRLDEVVRSGDVLVANEHIQRLRSGLTLPPPEDRPVDAFAGFFPAGAKLAEEALEQCSPSTGPLVDAIKRGTAFGAMSFTAPAAAQRETAAKLASTWFAVKRAPGQASVAQMIDLLAGLGFAGARASAVAATRERAEFSVTTERLADRSICPVPAFGSQANGRYRVVCVWGRPVDEDLPRLVGDTGSRPTIVLYFGRLRERHRRELARASRMQRLTYLMLDEVLMLHLCAQARSRLGAFFACALPFSCVEPYVTTSGLVPPEMFFGRKDELKAITNPSGGCFVYGGRQLGKTALLRAAERNFHQPVEHRFARWIDLKAEGIGIAKAAGDLWAVIYRELAQLGAPFDRIKPPQTAKRGGVDEFLAEMRGAIAGARDLRLLLLLDEADKFLEQDSRLMYQETQRLKNLMDATDRRVKIVFAGLHNVLRTTEQANHPLAHLGNPIEVGPLASAADWSEARSMIVGPLQAAGYELASEDLAIRILAQTNYYPGLVQLYGEEMLRLLHESTQRRYPLGSGPRYTVSEDAVDEAYKTKSLRDSIRARFQYTLQLDPRYEVIAYWLAHDAVQQSGASRNGVDLSEIKHWSSYWWPEGFGGTSEHEFRIILDELVGLGVLRHCGGRAYDLRNPNLIRLLGTAQDISDVLVKDREAPHNFEPDIFHAQSPRDGERASRRNPLSFTQEGRLLRPENGVSLVCGVGATGLPDLKDFVTSGGVDVRWCEDLQDAQGFRRAIDKSAEARKAGTTILFIPDTVPWSGPWVRQALDRTARLTSKDRYLRTVFVADPSTLWQVVRDLPALQHDGVEVDPLRPWHDVFVRQWLEDMAITGSDPGTRTQLHALTGFWPTVLRRVPPHCTKVSQLIDSIEADLTSPEIRESLLVELGLPSGPRREAIRLVHACRGESLSTLQEFSREYDGVEPGQIVDVVAWAELLQLIRPEDSGWAADPLVARLME